MTKCIIYTCAYNAEKVFMRTANSILNQTYTNWVWYIVDNGSTDSTAQIISNLSAEHDNIIRLHNKQNNVWEDGNFFLDVVKSYDDDDYFCMIDADDEYKPNFLQDSVSFMEQHDLDIVASGNDLVDITSYKFLGDSRIRKDLVLTTGKEISDNFYILLHYLWTWWGKLYRIKTIKTDFMPLGVYGMDTIYTTMFFTNADRIGILAKSLHKYYVTAGTTSVSSFNVNITTPQILHETYLKLLMQRCGYISEKNTGILMSLYMISLFKTVPSLMQSQVSIEKKLANILEIGRNKYTIQLALTKDLAELGEKDKNEMKIQLFTYICDFLLKVQNVDDGLVEDYCACGEMCASLLERHNDWLHFQQTKLNYFISINDYPQAYTALQTLLDIFPDNENLIELEIELKKLNNPE